MGSHSLLQGISWTRDRTWVSPTAGRFFTESPGKPRRDAGTKYFLKLRRGRRRNIFIVLLSCYHKLFTMSRRKSVYRKSREIHRSQTQRVCTDSYQQPNMKRVMMLGNYIHNHISHTSTQIHHTHSTYTIHFIFFLDCCYAVSKSCLTLCDPLDGSLPSSSVHGISQARILECVAIFFSGGSFRLRDQTQVSCIAGGFFTTEPPGKPPFILQRYDVTYLSKLNTHFRVWLSSDQRTWNNKK